MYERKTSAGAVRNLSKKLHAIDILRKFAIGMTVVSDCLRTLRIKMISITLPFDSRKSRKFTRISQWIASDAHTYMAWVAPAVLLIRVVREPTWAKCRRVCSRLLFLSIYQSPDLMLLLTYPFSFLFISFYFFLLNFST